MQGDLQKKLYKDFPELFEDKDKSMRETAMCWGIECGDGWFWVLYLACTLITFWCFLSRRELPRFSQVKEKYGTLRIHIWGGDEVIYWIIDQADNLSSLVCEECGWPGYIRDELWLKAACDKHK